MNVMEVVMQNVEINKKLILSSKYMFPVGLF